MSSASKSRTAAALRAVVQAAQSKTSSGGGEAAEFWLLPPAGKRLQQLSDAIHLLTGSGVTARTARAAAEQLATDRIAYVAAPHLKNAAAFRKAFGALGIAVRRLKPREVDVKALRESLGYSQAEFARLLGFTLDSVQNWEQPGRPKPQGAALTILSMAAKDFQTTVRMIADSQEAA